MTVVYEELKTLFDEDKQAVENKNIKQIKKQKII